MDRRSIVLAALAPAKGTLHSPVQLQKLLFLIDRSISDKVGGPHFSFQPYDYGPFDKDVYNVVEELVARGWAQTAESGRAWKKLGLTAAGQSEGDTLLNSLDPKLASYIRELSKFVLSLSFTQLVSAIYKAYPEMKVNSVFRG